MGTKTALLFKGQSDVRERRLELEKLYQEEINMIFVDQVSSLDALEALISDHPDSVMIEAEIIPKLVLAEVILNTEIPSKIDIRGSITTDYLDDDKTRWLIGFRKYTKPIKKIEFY